MVGAARFELATSCTPSKRASQAAPQPEASIVHDSLAEQVERGANFVPRMEIAFAGCDVDPGII